MLGKLIKQGEMARPMKGLRILKLLVRDDHGSLYGLLLSSCRKHVIVSKYVLLSWRNNASLLKQEVWSLISSGSNFCFVFLSLIFFPFFSNLKVKAKKINTETYLQFCTFLSEFEGIGSYEILLTGTPKHTALPFRFCLL